MIKIKRSYSKVDLLFFVIGALNLHYLFKSLESGEIYFRALKFSSVESPMSYWGVLFGLTFTLIATIFFILFYDSEKGALNKN